MGLVSVVFLLCLVRVVYRWLKCSRLVSIV